MTDETNAGRQPRGTLVLRTVAMPRDANPNGDIFGGWILAQMDLAGGLMATQIAGCVKKLRLDLWNNVFTYDIGLCEQYLLNRMEDFSTIILGETATGKGRQQPPLDAQGFIAW